MLNPQYRRMFSTGFTPASESQIFFLVGELTLFCPSLFYISSSGAFLCGGRKFSPFRYPRRCVLWLGSERTKRGDCGGGNQVTSHFSIGRQNNFQPRSRIIPAMPNGETVPAETFSALQSTKLTSAVLVGSSIDTAQNAERVRRQAQGRARAFSTFFLVQGAEPQARPPSHYSPFQTFNSGLSPAAPCPSYVCVHRLSFVFTLPLKGGLEFICALSH